MKFIPHFHRNYKRWRGHDVPITLSVRRAAEDVRRRGGGQARGGQSSAIDSEASAEGELVAQFPAVTITDDLPVEIDMELDDATEEILCRHTKPGEEAAFIRAAIWEKAATHDRLDQRTRGRERPPA